MIPISLIVTLELVKAAMGFFLEKDEELLSEKVRFNDSGK